MSFRHSAIKTLSAVMARPGLTSLWSDVSLVTRYFEGLGSGSSIDRSGELAVIQRVARNPHIPSTYIDVGANIGDYTAHLLTASPSAKIYAFDASPFAARKLEERFKDEKGVMVVPLGLSNRAETRVLRSPTQHAGVASFYEHLGEEIECTSITECTTLDAYCDTIGLGEIGLLKVDVEGHEYSVLEGAAKLLDAGAIHAIQFDGGASFASRIFFRDFWLLFSKCNYRISRVLPSGVIPVCEYRERDEVCLPTIYLAERCRT